MSVTEHMFDMVRLALQKIYDRSAEQDLHLDVSEHLLILELPTDIAAFTVVEDHVAFETAYQEFKGIYRSNATNWESHTLSFVVCRYINSNEDLFFSELERDPLFCRKYVLRAYDDLEEQRSELLHLPFLPFVGGDATIERPQSAQDFLQSVGLSPSLSQKLVEPRVPGQDAVAQELSNGAESFPSSIIKTGEKKILWDKPGATTRLESITMEGFRAYKKAQALDLNAAVVVLFGRNGLGKTSVFDAIDFACTGRIGRLQQNNKADITHLTTHLGKTFGTGSVQLTGSMTQHGKKISTWNLERGTGQAIKAQLNGKDFEKNAVLNFLTLAKWLEARPRPRTFDNLFRATHFFSQNEQELLLDFRKESAIPADLVSEMLSLQDYSQGIGKTEGIITSLAVLKKPITEQVNDLNLRKRKIEDSLSKAETLTAGSSTPIDRIVSQLNSNAKEQGISDFELSRLPTLTSVMQWKEVLEARLHEIHNQIELANEISIELPTFERQSLELLHAEKDGLPPN